MNAQETVHINIDLLDEPYYNPRSHPQEQIDNLAKSLSTFGQRRTISVWAKPDGRFDVLAGNGITKAAKQAGLKEMKCTLAPVEWDETFRKAYSQADNQGGYVDDQLKIAAILEEIANDGRIALEAVGSSRQALDNLLEELANQQLEANKPGLGGDEFEVPEELEPRAKFGDVWQLGNHKIACLDSTNAEQVKWFLNEVKVDLVWSDPPYGMNLDTDFSSAKSRLDFAEEKSAFGGNSYPAVIGDDKDFDPRPLINLIKAKEQFWWGADYYAERLLDKNKGSWLVWDKRVEESLDTVYGSSFETCWSKTKHKRDIIRIKWAGIFGMEKEDTKKRVHPTQKPVALAEWAFDKYGKAGDIIFDPFLGSGMSIIAAQRLGRTVYGCELSPGYIDVCIKRFEAETGLGAELVSRLEFAENGS